MASQQSNMSKYLNKTAAPSMIGKIYLQLLLVLHFDLGDVAVIKLVPAELPIRVLVPYKAIIMASRGLAAIRKEK